MHISQAIYSIKVGGKPVVNRKLVNHGAVRTVQELGAFLDVLKQAQGNNPFQRSKALIEAKEFVGDLVGKIIYSKSRSPDLATQQLELAEQLTQTKSLEKLHSFVAAKALPFARAVAGGRLKN